METWLDKLAANHGNFIRIWLSAPAWDVESVKSGQYDPDRAKTISTILAAARKHGIRAKLTLEHFRSVVPNVPTSKSWSNKALHHTSVGGPAKDMADFVNNPACRKQFIAKLEWLHTQFGDDPAIFGLELWNEMNAVGGGDYMDWTRAMLPELHRIFPKNLCMQSLGSFDTDRVRKTYREHALIPGNDLAQVHRYLDLGAALDVCHGPVDVLAAEAVREMLAANPGRPVMLAESGAVEPKHSGPFKLYAADKSGMILHDVLFAPFFAGAAACGQCWHWDHYIDKNNLWWHFSRFATATEGIDPPSQKFQPGMTDHQRLRLYTLHGTTQTLVWCRDTQNTWQTELADQKPPEELKEIEIDLSPHLGRTFTGAAQAYDPWTDKKTTLRAAGGKCILPAFSRSLVLRIPHA
ncbi:MAG: hypothetical protein ABSH20_07205 [Tepidisphaeraceae bacterium]|jgi:hypothetical protein